MTGRPFRTTRRIANLRAGRNDWYRITNATATLPAQVNIYDEIGFFGVTAQDFVKDLADVSGDLDIHLNCPGGDVFDAVAIYNALKQHEDGIVKVYVDGLAASAASFIAQAADPGNLIIARNASMMIHDAFGMGIGNAKDMRQLADLLDQQSDNIASIYAERSGKPVAQWREAMRAESWYVGQQAVDAGLADFVQGGPEVSDAWDLSVFARQQVFDADYDTSAWDGNAAMSACSSAADYRSICAGEHSHGSPDERAHWALPHHKSPGAAPNRAGVNNALSRLPQTQDLANRQAAESHLQAHARLWSGDSGSSQDNFSDFGEIIRSAFARKEGSA